MTVQIDKTMKRVRAYWFVDGFTEMAVGALFVLISTIILAQGFKSPISFPSSFLSVTAEITVTKFLGSIVIIFALWWLKDHFTYPRTGFARGNRITLTQILILGRQIFLVILLPIFGLIALALIFAPVDRVLSPMPIWLPVAVSLIWSFLYILAGEWTGIRRFRPLGILIFLSGIGVGIWQYRVGTQILFANIKIGITQPEVLEIFKRALVSLSVLIFVCGIILTISGFITFLYYRKENPLPYSEEA